jgi:hypothetical protein
MRVLLLLTLSVLGPLAGALQAQRLQTFGFSTLDSTSSDSTSSDRPVTARLEPSVRRDGGLLAAGGVAGGVVGVFGGAWIGASMAEHGCEDCGIAEAIYGGIAGGSALLPLGVHLANGRRGRYGPSLLASLAIGAAGFALASATDEWRIMLGVPIAQIVSSIAIERGTSR